MAVEPQLIIDKVIEVFIILLCPLLFLYDLPCELCLVDLAPLF